MLNFSSVSQVEDNLMKVRNAGTEQDLGIQYKALKPEVDKLNIMAAKRQQVKIREENRPIRRSSREQSAYQSPWSGMRVQEKGRRGSTPNVTKIHFPATRSDALFVSQVVVDSRVGSQCFLKISGMVR